MPSDLPTKEQIESFLEDLSELSRKHGITIDGCGCCGSPGLSLTDNLTGSYKHDGYGDYLDYGSW